MFFREQWIDNCLDIGIDKPLEYLVGDTEQRYCLITLYPPRALLALGSQLQGLFSRPWEFLVGTNRKKGSQVTRTSRQLSSMDYKLWAMQSGPGALPGFKC